MPDPWVLELTRPHADPRVRVGGLNLALRLALDAQWAGASAIVLGRDVPELAELLDDPRLKILILEQAEPGARVMRIPASYVVHRQTLKELRAANARELDVLGAAPVPDVAFAFEPIDVVDAHTRDAAERALFRSLRKPQDGWTSRYLNRHISLFLSRWLVKTSLLPNQVSIGILAIGLFGAWLASHGTYASLLVGALLFQAQSVLDGCDGEMSRVTYRGSLTGEWLDTVGDDLTNYSFFVAAGIGLYRTTGNTLWLAAALVTVGAGVVASGLEYRYLIGIGSGDLLKYPLSDPASGASSNSALSRLQPLFKRDTFVLLTLVAACLGLVGPMLVLFAAGAVGILINVLLAERRMARQRAGE